MNDLAIGARWSPAAGIDSGAAFVYLSVPGAGPPPAFTAALAGSAPYEWFGYSVAVAGDLDGDLYGDVAVGGPGQGRAAVYFGAAGDVFDPTPDLVFLIGVDYLGSSVAAAPAF